MWFDGVRQPDTLYVASVSRGKDSTAMLRAVQLMGWPLDAICAVDVWATDDIPAELPPMVAFKDEWDEKCLKWFGVPVTRLCAMRKVDDRERERRSGAASTPNTSTETQVSQTQSETGYTGSPSERELGATADSRLPLYEKMTYEKGFYHIPKRKPKPQRERERENKPYGFACIKGNWCTALKTQHLGQLNQGIPRHSQKQVVSRLQTHLGQTNTPTDRDGQRGTACGATQSSRAKFSMLFHEAPERGAKNKYRSLHRRCG